MKEDNYISENIFDIKDNKLLKYNGKDEIVYIPNNVEEIGKSCFANNNFIKKVYFPSTLHTICKKAFSSCTSLEEIEMTDALTDIEADAFSGCDNLYKICFSHNLVSIGANILFGTKIINNKENWEKGLFIVDGYLLASNNEVEEFCNIPEGCISIAQGCFIGCKNIRTVKMPNSIKFIGKKTFQGCAELERVIFSNQLMYIPKFSFKNCRKLKFIENLDEEVTYVHTNAFVNCTAIDEQMIEVIERCINSKRSDEYNNLFIKESETSENHTDEILLIIEKLFDDWTLITEHDISTLRSIKNGIKFDKDGWKFSYSEYEKPQRVFLDGFDKNIARAAKNFKKDKKTAIKGILNSYGVMFLEIYRSINGMSLYNEEIDIEACFVVDGIKYNLEEVNLFGQTLFQKITTNIELEINKAVKSLDNDSIDKLYYLLLKINSQNFMEFKKHFDNYANLLVYSMRRYDSAKASCIDVCSFVEKCNFSNHEKFSLLYGIAIVLRKIGEFIVASRTLEKAKRYAYEQPELLDKKTIKELNIKLRETKTEAFEMYQELFAKYEWGEHSVFDGIATLEHKDCGLYVDNCLMCVEKETTGIFCIKDGCEYIGDGAFAECEGIEEIVLPDSVIYISNGAFANCSSLEKIIIPESVTKIGEYAFSFCQKLKTIKFPSRITCIEEGLCEYCDSLEDIKLSRNITLIATDAFVACNSLRELSIPEFVEKIEKDAFFMCENLKYITINSPNVVIEEGNFDYILEDKWYENIIIEAYEGSGADTYAQENCFVFNSLGGIKPARYKIVADILRQYTGDDEKLVLPDGINLIGDNVFKDCASLKEIIIPNSVTKIGVSAFSGCVNLEKVTFPSELEIIDSNAFRDCKNLQEIIFPESLRVIYDYAFSGCVNIKTVVIPSNVTKLRSRCFNECVNLRNVVISSPTTEIKSQAFFGCSPELVIEGMQETERVTRVDYSNTDIEDEDYDDFMNDLI